MALLRCVDCGREVSDQAASCPGCGRPRTAGGDTAQHPGQATAPTPPGPLNEDEAALSILDAGKRRRRNLGIGAGVVVIAALAAVQVARAVNRPRPAPWVDELAKAMTGGKVPSVDDVPFRTTREFDAHGTSALTLRDATHVQTTDFAPAGGVKLVTKAAGRNGSEEQWFVIRSGPLAKTILVARTRSGESSADEFFVLTPRYACTDARPAGIDGAPEAVCAAAANLVP